MAAPLDPTAVRAFLAGRRLAVVGASDSRQNFGRTVYRELRDHGHEVVAGACPLMFLEPVAAIHRIHRGLRRMTGAVARPA